MSTVFIFEIACSETNTRSPKAGTSRKKSLLKAEQFDRVHVVLQMHKRSVAGQKVLANTSQQGRPTRMNLINSRTRIFVSLCTIALLVLVAPCRAFAQQAALDRDFHLLVENRQFNGGVLIARKGKVLYQKTFGYADFADHRKNTPAIRFPIASISKLLTATAILQLVQAGRLELNEPVVKYLPQFPYREITVRNLLSHTSGLPPYNAYFNILWQASPERIFTNADFLPVISANPLPLLYSPGDKQNYDNINYIVLALVLEKVSGDSYRDYIRKHILRPADMQQTEFLPLPVQYNELHSDMFAYPHVYPRSYSEKPIRANTVPYIRHYWHSYAFSGFADYVSTMRDLLKLDAAYRDGLLLNQATQALAFTRIAPRLDPERKDVFGLGWEIEPDTGLGRVVYHSGAATGLSCVLLRDLNREQTVIVFDNTHANAHEIADRALNILNGRTPPPPRKSAARIYVQTLLKDGPEAAHQTLRKLLSDPDNFVVSEDEFNTSGYELMGANNTFHLAEEIHLDPAIDVFHTNVELFPKSWNAWDSYGEALRKANRIPESLQAYRQSLALKSDNDGAKKAIQEMQAVSTR